MSHANDNAQACETGDRKGSSELTPVCDCEWEGPVVWRVGATGAGVVKSGRRDLSTIEGFGD